MGKKRAVTLGLEEKTTKKKEIKKPKQKEQKTEETTKEQEVKKESKKEKKQKTVSPIAKKHGKKYKAAQLKRTAHKPYAIKEAVALIKKIAYENFDATVELHINTIDQSPKGEVQLPHGTGKQLNIVVFDNAVEEKIKGGVFDFDILLARPDDMKDLVKYARVLGPKGLMPSPKKGTVVANIEEAKKKFTAGSIQYKTESKFPIIHQSVGKKSFTEKQLEENIFAFLRAVGTKNIKNAFLSTSMSPSVELDISAI